LRRFGIAVLLAIVGCGRRRHRRLWRPRPEGLDRRDAGGPALHALLRLGNLVGGARRRDLDRGAHL